MPNNFIVQENDQRHFRLTLTDEQGTVLETYFVPYCSYKPGANALSVIKSDLNHINAFDDFDEMEEFIRS